MVAFGGEKNGFRIFYRFIQRFFAFGGNILL